MATFIAIIDVLGLITSIISIIGLVGFYCWVGGKENWSFAEIIATVCGVVLWSSKLYSKRTMVAMWCVTLAVTAVFGMVMSFWFAVVCLAISVMGTLFFGAKAKPALF